jgi:hypothetical protein
MMKVGATEVPSTLCPSVGAVNFNETLPVGPALKNPGAPSAGTASAGLPLDAVGAFLLAELALPALEFDDSGVQLTVKIASARATTAAIFVLEKPGFICFPPLR